MYYFSKRKNKADLNSSIDISWDDAHKNAKQQECVKMGANDYAYILYTSGTTGLPKGIVRDIGGHIVALKWTMKNIYNINPNDVWWSASDRMDCRSTLYSIWTIVLWLYNNSF